MERSVADTYDSSQTKREKVTTTLVCPLRTSNRKNQFVQERINQFQAVLSHMNNMVPTLSPSQYKNKSVLRRLVKQYSGRTDKIYKKVQYQAGYLVGDTYSSNEKKPSEFAGNYIRFRKRHIKEISIKNEKYGILINFGPVSGGEKPFEKNEIWFGLDIGQYQKKYLDMLRDDESEFTIGDGSELRLNPETGSLSLHLTVNQSVTMFKKNSPDRVMGVDIGIDRFYYAVVIDSDGNHVASQNRSAGEFINTVNDMRKKIKYAKEKNQSRRVKKLYQQKAEYTQQMYYTVANEIVDFAAEHEPIKIHLENLTGLHNNRNRQNPWPYRNFQTKIAYKSRQRGIPVYTVPSRNTSRKCPKCGHTSIENDRRKHEFNPQNRFICQQCGYQNNPDFIGALNIARDTESSQYSR